MKSTIHCLLFCLLAACQNSSNKKISIQAQSAGADSAFQPAVVLPDSGWTVLFDGHSMDQWHTYGKKAPGKAWNIDSGSIHITPGAKNGYQTAGGGDLITNDSFSNFDLKLEWKIGKKANSGIMLYVQEDPARYKETWNTGPEVQVCDPDSNEDAHSTKHEAGDIYDLISSRTRAALPAMEWNQLEIVSDHGKLDIYFNNEHTISTRLWDDEWRKKIAASKFSVMPGFGSFQSGHIALQDHGEEVWYRNIRIRKF